MIFLSEANTANLISGILVLSGVAAAPLIAFFTTVFNRRHEEHRNSVSLLKPVLEDVVEHMVNIIQQINYLHSKCHGKTLGDVISEARLGTITSDFPLNYIMSIKSDVDRLSKFVISGVTRFPGRILGLSSAFSSECEDYIQIAESVIMIEDKVIDMNFHDHKIKIMRKQFSKITKSIRKFLGVR